MRNVRRRPRVLLVSHYYPPHLGGIENVVRNEALHLARHGADVTVLTSGDRAGTHDEDGVRVVRVAASNVVERRSGVPFPLFSPALLPTALRWARHADVVHVHDCLYASSWAAGLAAAVTRTPTVVTQHVGLVAHPSALVRAVQHVVYAVAGRPQLRRARRVLTLNADVAAFVRKLGARAEARHHLANGVDTSLFRPPADPAERAAARARLGLPAGRTLVLFAGRLVPKKGYGLLLDAHAGDSGDSGDPGNARDTRDAHDCAYDLVFAGDGDSAALTGRSGVHHLGALSAEDLADAYRACDIFALPSTAEGFPLTVQEAMASGLPVVTTDDPGYAPYGLDRGVALLVPRTVPALRAALDALVADPGGRAEMGTAARAFAEASFGWDRHVTALLGHYRDVGRG
ncbi:glycosyltransferase family 4 protein [Streptomyces sp. NPDC090131]|uniref:glycosyltransferase family 4 protein n=1 Tax=Streptomyces sp. NPDC090131 TaxID=3365954 RepID=UPI003823361D